MSERQVIRIASRTSTLAVIQRDIVFDNIKEIIAKLAQSNPSVFSNIDFEPRGKETAGDKNQSRALFLVGGGKPLWTLELEEDLKDREVDLLVHSLKDVPTTLPPEFELGAITEREDPVDSLVVKDSLLYKNLDQIPDGSVIGTSSVRRVAQLKRIYPKLKFESVRGNLNTRLAKLDDPNGVYSALILAKSGLVRLGMGHRITADIPAPTLFHAVGQGALAVEIRAKSDKDTPKDDIVRQICEQLTHWQTEWSCRAERAMLHELEGGCSVPVGANTSLKEDEGKRAGTLTITGTVTGLDGNPHFEHTLSGYITSPKDAEALGAKLAAELKKIGAEKVLTEIVAERTAAQKREQEKEQQQSTA